MTYPGFGKIPRFNRDIIVSEKVDGSNGQILFRRDIDPDSPNAAPVAWLDVEDGKMGVWAGSRKRWINPGADNFGFAKWVQDNAQALFETLGEGTHWGEWWGSGIQRGYGLTNGERYFSLFNTSRWEGIYHPWGLTCVPVLWKGNMKDFEQEQWLQILQNHGSFMVDGWMASEGLVIFHTASNHLYKVTLIDDEIAKSAIKGAGNVATGHMLSEPVDGTW